MVAQGSLLDTIVEHPILTVAIMPHGHNHLALAQLLFFLQGSYCIAANCTSGETQVSSARKQKYWDSFRHISNFLSVTRHP